MKKEIEAFVNAANEQVLEAAWNNLSAEEQLVFEQLMEEDSPEDALAFFAQLYDDTPKEQSSETCLLYTSSAYDFGDSIRTGANDCAEDEPDQSKVHFDLHLYEVFAKGYLSTAGASMRRAEKKSLAWGARLMTLECGIRFLTDYLEGDHYFHIARLDHNLDRARTQFTLVRQMEEVFDQMLEIVCPDNH